MTPAEKLARRYLDHLNQEAAKAGKPAPGEWERLSEAERVHLLLNAKAVLEDSHDSLPVARIPA